MHEAGVAIDALWSAAADVLRRDAPAGAPGRVHDASVVAAGLSRFDLPGAIDELQAVIAARSSSGMLPQLRTSSDATAPVRTGRCALPAQAIVLRSILDRGRDLGGADLARAEDFAATAFGPLLEWHRWLRDVRDPGGTGLLEIRHPCESGFETSLRWDEPLARGGDFRVRDVLFSAIFAAAAEVLAGIGDEVGRSDATAELTEMAAVSRRAVAGSVDPASGLARDVDVPTGAWLPATTVAGFAPLVAGGEPDLMAGQRAILAGERWMGHPVLRHPLPPTVSPASPGFRRRRLWSGPIWPPMTVLLGWAARRDSAWGLYDLLRDAALDLLADGSFGEQYEPITGEPLGDRDHPWTAAMALEWLG